MSKKRSVENRDINLIAHTSLRDSTSEDWYFDSGCSRHMTGVQKMLVDVKPHPTGFVRFGDGFNREIKGVGKFMCDGCPRLEGVLFVKGLIANLISISQLCDQGLLVNFSKSECLVKNEKEVVLMKGIRSKDNCYLWESQIVAYSSTYSTTKEDEVKLWHQKLGHLHFKRMKEVISEGAIRDMPELKIEEGEVYDTCESKKKIMMSHPMLQHHTTSKILELLHMDVMEPLKIDSLGGKMYVFVIVDDFSGYTLMNFLKEK